MNQEIITRRRLPHWYVPGAMFFVTYRLVDTFPVEALKHLNEKRDCLLNQKPAAGFTQAQHRTQVHKLLFADYDRWLDQSKEHVWLADPRIAAMVRANLYHHHGNKYHLLSHCIMPNHVHVLFQPIFPQAEGRTDAWETVGERDDDASPLSRIMHSLKSYTAHEANKVLRRNGSFWQRESYDHWVRDEGELERIVEYIQANPVKAGLVGRPQDWFYCSGHDRFLADGENTGWLQW